MSPATRRSRCRARTAPLGSGETVQVSSDGGASWADVTTSTASTWSYTDPTPHATSFTYQARIIDAVGNVGANTASQAVTIDTVAPTAPSITSIAENGGGGINAGEAADGTPVVVGLTGTGAAAGDTLTVNWGGQTVIYTLLAGDISASSATVTVPAGTITAQGNGTFDVTARLTDAAGNASAELIGHIGDGRHGGADGAVDHLDRGEWRRRHQRRRGRGRHAGGGRADRHRGGGGRHADVSWGSQTVTYTLLAGDISGSSATVTVPPATITAQGQGTFGVTARLTDVVGNASATSGAFPVTVDTVAPTAPSITSITENSGGGINTSEASDGTPVVVGLTGTGAAAGDTLTVSWGGQTVTYTLLAGDISASSATVTVPAGTITAQGQGTFDVTARLTDAAGNAGANSTATPVTVDAVAPTATVAITAITDDNGTSSSDYVTSDTTLTVSGTHGPLGSGEKVQVSSDGGASWAAVTTSTASTWSYTDPTPHATSFTYQVRIVDAVGNVSANTASQAVTIDTAAPTAPSITSIPENGGGGINAGEAANGTPVVVGLAGTGAAAGDTLTVNWGGQTVTYTLLAADISASSATVTVPLATIAAQGQGTFNVTARLTDAAGNAGANSSATSVTVDAGAPTATVAITAIADDNGTSSSDYVTSDTTLTVSGTHGALGSGEKVQVSSDGGASWADATSTASTWSFTDPATHGTSFTYQVRIVDAVGNVDANTASQAVTIDTAAPNAPSITSIPENAGGGINTIEAANGTPVVVGLAGTGAATGDTLTVTWGGQTVTYTLVAGRHLGRQRDGDGAPGDDHGAGQWHVRRDGPADRCGGQCRRQLDGDPGNGRHGWSRRSQSRP